MTTKSNNDQFGQEQVKPHVCKLPDPNKAVAYMIASHLLMMRSQIETLINKIPTSEARSVVCDANIYLGLAVDKLKAFALKIDNTPEQTDLNKK